MNNANSPYNQQDSKAESRESKVNAGQMPQGPVMSQPVAQPMPMPMPPMPQMRAPRRARNWRERLLGGNNARTLTVQQERSIPQWLAGKAMAFFFVAMGACWIAFGHVPEFNLWFTASVSVILFFYGGFSMTKSWSRLGEKQFLKYVLLVGIVLRLMWAFYGYFFFNMEHYGHVYGDDADTGWFMGFGKDLAQWLAGNSRHTLAEIIDYQHSAIDDVGYPMWLGFVFLIFGANNDTVIPFILKSIIGAFCAISIYNVAKRHYGDGTARMAAIFVALNPNMIYWCGTMMKETEMVFLVCLAVDNFDRVLSSGQKYTFKALLPGVFAASALFFFRSALAIVLFLAVFAHIVMASRRVMSLGKKILAGVMVGLVLFIGMGDRIRSQSEKLLELAQSGVQEKSMNYRAIREDGNSFAKYAGAAVFAPLIFTIPFPTFNDALEYQYTQKFLAGGSYIKNILSFFVIMVMVLMLLSGEWRKHVFIIAYTGGYLAVLVMSSFAQSGRFHMPVMPMLMLFAAYGVQMAKTNPRLRKWWPMVLVAEVVVCLAWNWFKLAGRGMI